MTDQEHIKILQTVIEKYEKFIQHELNIMRKLVAEQEGGILAPVANVMKGQIAKYRTVLE